MPHIVVDEGDNISHLSVSDAATACITSRRHQIFICINYAVLRCERLENVFMHSKTNFLFFLSPDIIFLNHFPLINLLFVLVWES